jgi:hypothetical protein
MIGHYLSTNNEKRYSSLSQKVSGTKQPLNENHFSPYWTSWSSHRKKSLGWQQASVKSSGRPGTRSGPADGDVTEPQNQDRSPFQSSPGIAQKRRAAEQQRDRSRKLPHLMRVRRMRRPRPWSGDPEPTCGSPSLSHTPTCGQPDKTQLFGRPDSSINRRPCPSCGRCFPPPSAPSRSVARPIRLRPRRGEKVASFISGSRRAVRVRSRPRWPGRRAGRDGTPAPARISARHAEPTEPSCGLCCMIARLVFRSCLLLRGGGERTLHLPAAMATSRAQAQPQVWAYPSAPFTRAFWHGSWLSYLYLYRPFGLLVLC